MIEEKVIQMGAPFTFFNVNLPAEVVADLKIKRDDVLTFRKTLISDGESGDDRYGYTIEVKNDLETTG